MKFCKDCKHYRTYLDDNALCEYRNSLSNNIYYDLVTGKKYKRYRDFAKDQRTDYNANAHCGFEARHFEPAVNKLKQLWDGIRFMHKFEND